MTEFKALISQMNSFEELELIKSQYSDISIENFHAELNFIEKWIMSDATNPLIIRGKPLSGKKALLCSYLSYSKKKYSNFFHIACFGSLTPIYSQILYKIMAELRNHFSVNQKLEINEEKLRRYFKYWLDITSNIIQKEYVGYSSQKKPKIIIFIEGLDVFVDNKNSPVNPQFWLPQFIPKNVRLILFTSLETKQFKHATFYDHSLSEQKIQKLTKSLKQKDLIISNRLNVQQFKIVEKMMKKCTQLKISKLQNFKQFLKEYINCVATDNISPEQLKSILYVLTLTKKGLQKKQIKQITNLTIQLFDYCLKFFDSIISQHKGCFYVLSKNIRTCIQDIVDPDLQKKKTYHQIIAKNLRKQSISFRRLFEIIHHLMECQNYNDLKELITKVQNFLLLYTPYGKNILCQCWSKLESIEQFDPVLEYNKSVEAFNNHYYLKESELYKIVFQLCMFFKEYSDFQNFKTPCFRHPQIKGQLDQFQEINIYEELFSLNMVGKCKNYKLKKMNELGINQKRKITKKKDVKEDSAKITLNKLARQEREKSLQQNNEKIKLFLEPESLETSRPNTCEDQASEKDNEKDNENQQNFNIQQLNLNIQTNQEKFKKFYQKSINQYLIKYFIPKNKNNKQKEHLFQSDQSDEQQKNIEKQDKDLKIEVEKIKDCLFLKIFREYEQQNYYKSSEDVKYYYYKQWVWLQFPWLCQSINHNYSKMINQCINKSIEFMSTEKQNNLIRQVLKITQIAKESKTNIYQKKKIQIYSIKMTLSKTKNNPDLNKSYIQPKNDQNTIKNMNTKIKSIAKFKLDPKNIDEEITKLRKEKLKDKTNLDYFNSLQNGFLTQAAGKLNSQKQARWLPILQHSKFMKKPKIIKEKGNIYDSRDYTQMIRKYNEVKHQNDMLVQRIEQIKNRSTLFNEAKAEESKQKLLNAIMDLENKKKSLDHRFKNQEELQKKLKIILRICELNKIYGSQSDHLADYLNNLKHIIQIEEGKSQKIKKRINQYIEDKRKTVKQLRQKKKKLKGNPFDLKNINLTTNIDKENNLFEIEQEEDLKDLRTDKTQIKQSFNNHLQNKNYQILQQKLNLKYESQEKDQLVSEFIEKFQKHKELSFINQELRTSISKARQQLKFLATILNNDPKSLGQRQTLTNLKENEPIMTHGTKALF